MESKPLVQIAAGMLAVRHSLPRLGLPARVGRFAPTGVTGQVNRREGKRCATTPDYPARSLAAISIALR
jgi:hypothetical protein